MKLMKTVKKIAALSTGAAMVGATVMTATAQDLGNFPEPFVENGQFNALIVVGDSANAADVLGSVDIATSLQFASRTRRVISSSGGSTTVNVDGDAWQVGTSSKEFELSEVGGNGESINSVQEFIDKDDLDILADGTFSNSEGDFDYEQFIHFDNTASQRVQYREADDGSNDDTSDIFFWINQNDAIARFELEFKKSAESDVSGTTLTDFEDETITFLGQTFDIVQAETSGNDNKGIKLTLMQGAVRDVLDEGDTKTYTIDGKDFEVTANFVDSTRAKFIVNGELTDNINDGETEKLADGTEIGVSELLAQDFSGGTRKVEFFLGAQKVILDDTDISDAATSKELDVGSENIDGVDVIIEGTNTTTQFNIDSIALNMTADDSYFVAAGEGLVQHIDEPEGFLNAWDIFFEGLPEVTTEEINLEKSGDDQYNLIFHDGSNERVKLPLVEGSNTSTLTIGDDDGHLVIRENQTISDEDYFIVTDESQDDGEEATFALQYTGADKSSDDNSQIRFKDLGSGETLDRSYSAKVGQPGVGSADANIKRGGQTFNVWNATLDTNKDFDIVVDLDGDGTLTNGAEVDIETNAGARISIVENVWGKGLDSGDAAGGFTNNTGVYAGNYLYLNITTPNTDDYDDVTPSAVGFNISTSSSEVTVAGADTVITVVSNPNDVDDTEVVWTALGARFTRETPSSSPEEVKGEYPTSQRLPLLFVQSMGTSVSTGETTEAGEIVYYDTEPISVGSAILASEFEDRGGFTNNHAILVGGPCANNAAAQLMGANPSNCVDGFTPGEAMIKTYQNANGRVAMLVAGFSAFDTRMAARVVANYEQWQDAGALTGTEVVVSGTSFTNIDVSAPAPAAAAPEDDGDDAGDAMEGDAGDDADDTTEN